MPIYTTYLAKNPKQILESQFGSWFIHFVMRKRGNDEVAPPEHLLKLFKQGKKTWPQFEADYLASLQPEINPWAITWMEKRAREARLGNVLLVCFEKDSTHCHRRLLAEEISRRFGVKYKGEL